MQLPLTGLGETFEHRWPVRPDGMERGGYVGECWGGVGDRIEPHRESKIGATGAQSTLIAVHRQADHRNAEHRRLVRRLQAVVGDEHISGLQVLPLVEPVDDVQVLEPYVRDVESTGGEDDACIDIGRRSIDRA